MKTQVSVILEMEIRCFQNLILEHLILEKGLIQSLGMHIQHGWLQTMTLEDSSQQVLLMQTIMDIIIKWGRSYITRIMLKIARLTIIICKGIKELHGLKIGFMYRWIVYQGTNNLVMSLTGRFNSILVVNITKNHSTTLHYLMGMTLVALLY